MIILPAYSGVSASAALEGTRDQEAVARNKNESPFLLDVNVGPIESIVSPCEVCETRKRKFTRQNDNFC